MTDISAAPSPVNFRHAAFMQSASAVENAPPDVGWEVAFAGRSNSGKSSAINTLTEQGKLARTSRTPGRTQLINFFGLSDSQRLVDLPGYGFAKVPLAVKKVESAAGALPAIPGKPAGSGDAHGYPAPADGSGQADAGLGRRRQHAGAYPAYQSGQTEARPRTKYPAVCRGELAAHAELVSVQCFSSLKRQGVDELGKQINRWLTDASVMDPLPESHEAD